MRIVTISVYHHIYFELGFGTDIMNFVYSVNKPFVEFQYIKQWRVGQMQQDYYYISFKRKIGIVYVVGSTIVMQYQYLSNYRT